MILSYMNISYISYDESRKVRANYLVFPYDSLFAKIIKNFVRIERAFYYILQGDTDFLFKILFKRVKKK